MTNPGFNIRGALPTDAEDIVRVHFAAVQATASSFYPSEIINNWSTPPDPIRFEVVKQAIENGQERFFVAEASLEIVGFGSIVPESNEFRALYVHPSFGRQGIGGEILQHLEVMAAKLGLEFLSLDASINSEAFYRRYGYEVIERGTHQLASGHEMACVKMRKNLTSLTS